MTDPKNIDAQTVDPQKRTTLKSMTAAAALTAMPAALTAASAVAASPAGDAAVESSITTAGLQIEVDKVGDITTSWLRFTNETGEAMTIKHVSPGVVVSDGEAFDINAVLQDNPLVINHDESYSFMVEPMHKVADALPVPSGRIGTEMAAVTSRYDSTIGKQFATTQRMILS